MKDICNDISDKSESKQEFGFTRYQNAVLSAGLLDTWDYQPYSAPLEDDLLTEKFSQTVHQ